MPDQDQAPNRTQNETARNQQPPNQNANNNTRRNGEANNCNPIVDKNFAGATPEVNAVMGLVFEKKHDETKVLYQLQAGNHDVHKQKRQSLQTDSLPAESI